jgi:hypothetical protein
MRGIVVRLLEHEQLRVGDLRGGPLRSLEEVRVRGADENQARDLPPPEVG